MLITFQLSETDLEYFRNMMKRACDSCQNLSPEQIIEKATATLAKVRDSGAGDFIREQMDQLGILIEMLNDERWNLRDEDCQRVLGALKYFSDPQGIIPDELPVLGYLDDAIMAELVCQEMQHEMQAYQEFLAFVKEQPNMRSSNDEPLNKDDWMEERRQQLHARMRRRRHGDSEGKTSKSPFSLF